MEKVSVKYLGPKTSHTNTQAPPCTPFSNPFSQIASQRWLNVGQGWHRRSWLATIGPMQFQPHIDTPACGTAAVFLAITQVLFDKVRWFIYPMKGNFVSILNIAVLIFISIILSMNHPLKVFKIDHIIMSWISQ